MNAEELRAAQAPLKERYKQNPAAAVVTMHATGTLDMAHLACQVKTFAGTVPAGLHPAAGGDGSFACSGDMLLQALVACTGVTLSTVATAMRLELRGGTITAEGTMDFRGTLGVNKDVSVGFTTIQLRFDLDTDADPEQIARLIALTERYCVIFQMLKSSCQLSVHSSQT